MIRIRKISRILKLRRIFIIILLIIYSIIIRLEAIRRSLSIRILSIIYSIIILLIIYSIIIRLKVIRRSALFKNTRLKR